MIVRLKLDAKIAIDAAMDDTASDKLSLAPLIRLELLDLSARLRL